MVRKGFFVMVVALLFGFNNMAFALPCSQGSVSGAIDCQDGTGNNDLVSFPLAVNEQSFFGFSDWDYLAKQNTPGGSEGSPAYDLNVDPATGTQEGNWSFSASVWEDFMDVMIVLKSGKTDGVFFSGYLLDNILMPDSGTWDTGGKDLSHLTLYGRGEGSQPPPMNPVPEPATMLLLGVGLAGLAGARLRKKK